MKTLVTDRQLTVFFEGYIDSSNALTVESEILSTLELHDYEKLVFDFTDLKYVSSAGLRIILKVRKINSDIKIINVCNEIYEILEMTGFTEMMTVEKAYKKVSVDNCEIIGRGSNGTVYRLDRDTVIKLYENKDALPDIQRERELARKALILGVPTAISYDVVQVGDFYGSVFELLNAESFSKLINRHPENTEKYIELYVDLLRKIHSTAVKENDMPDIKPIALNWVHFLEKYLPSDCYEKLVSLIEAIPVNFHMIHGDFHIKNVMMQDNEVLLIDMDTICHGDPVFEFASIFLAYVGFGELDHSETKRFLGIDFDFSRKIFDMIMRLYLKSENTEVLNSYIDKARIIGYARLMRRTIKRIGFENPDGKALIEYCKAKLIELVPRIDSLSYSLV